ncbi:MAG: iron-siderophore ABC transporter substrate-binding protein [Leptolyngbya sp. IPPAS B-1204]
MSRLVSRWIKPFLLFAFLSFLLANCVSPAIEQNVTSIQQPGTTSECRVIQHQFGETCVPLNPQRIVALDPFMNLDPLIALGIKPIGYTSDIGRGREIIASVSIDDVKGATNVGKSDQPSLEKVLQLKPDLILATDHHPYQLLSAIAPTVPVPPNFETPANEAFFKEALRYVARVIGKETKAEEVLNQYQHRIEELQQRLGNQLEQIEVSLIYYSNGYVYKPEKGHDAGTDVLIDTGLRYKLPPSGVPFSIETIEEYDADILFIVSFEQRSLSFFLQHPIFSHLKAVKTNRAYLVSQERWDTRGILGANQILDDLFKYLLEDE